MTVSDNEGTPGPGEHDGVVTAVQSGDEATFASLAERHRRELLVHCYRMLGNLDDAEDMVQETFTRAWRRRAGFEGRSTFRAWLYQISTNGCLDAIKRSKRRGRIVDVRPTADRPPSFDEVPWLQPFPDALFGDTTHGAPEPDAEVIAKETIE